MSRGAKKKHLGYNLNIMKKILLFAFLSFITVTSVTSKNLNQAYVVVEDDIILCSPNEHMDARSVRVDLLANDGSIQATAYTIPGGSVSFVRNETSSRVKSTYQFEDSEPAIIIDLVIN